MTWARPPPSTTAAIAPAARQTKSAACALTTTSVLDTGEPACVDDGHRAHLVLREAGLEQPVDHEGEPVLDGRVRALAEVGREHVPLHPSGANGLDGLLPADLARVDRGEAALEHGPAVGELALLVDRNALRGVVRMRHDDARHARGERRLDHRVDLLP